MKENLVTHKQGNFQEPGESTRQQLLNAAEELFAEKGFADTPVRDITTRAGCNLASVNYHFGSKENLYSSVFKRLLVELREYRISALQEVLAQPNVNLEAILRTFAAVFLEPLVDASRGRRMILLFMRELSRPRLPKGMMFEELIGPVSQSLREALHQQVPRLSEESAQLCIHSLVGQLLHIVQASKMFVDAGQTDAPILDLSKAVDHVVRFTVAGVRECAGEV